MNDPRLPSSVPESPVSEDAELGEQLRRLRYADPPAELRRRALRGAAAALDSRQAKRPAAWWRELALAGAATLLFTFSWPDPGPARVATPAPAAPAELASLLDLEAGADLALYLEKRWLTSSTLASASRSPTFIDPS